MARKNLLAALSAPELPAGNFAMEADETGQGDAPHMAIMGARGAIGAVSRSIEQLKASSIVDLKPDLIEASFITDRLQADEASHLELMASIREHGQQVPILVRPHPNKPAFFQIAYGRRRLRAAAELGRPVRAVVKSLSDQQLVVAQGQENSARTDLSFIEKALFAAKLEEGGFNRETIMASLSIDKTGLSRLISAAVKVPREIIEAVGPAPKAGRDRWSELATRLETEGSLARVNDARADEGFALRSSDERFALLFDAAAPKSKKPAKPTVWKASDGTRVALIRDDERSLTLAIDKRRAGEFGAYLVENLGKLYTAFKDKTSDSR